MAGHKKGSGFSKGGFTLVELLVVITIISMLMALLLPAIQAARESGRRSTCSNNMRNLGVALSRYQDTKRSFPGYVNVVNDKRASWVVMILPDLERADLYQVWQNVPRYGGTTPSPNWNPQFSILTTASPWAYAQLNLLVCPSNPGTISTNPLSYVVNCGSAASADDNFPPMQSNPVWEDLNSGIFFNHSGADWQGTVTKNFNPGAMPSMQDRFKSPKNRTSIDFISTNDGTSNTLLLSENLQASNWATDPMDPATNSPNNPWQSDFQVKQNTGFVWFISNNGSSVINNEEPTLHPYAKINALAKSVTPPNLPAKYNLTATPTPTYGLACARPSAQHPGGVNAFFVDQHYRFIAEDIPYRVFTQLCTPRQAAVLLPSGLTPQTTVPPWTYILNETDY